MPLRLIDCTADAHAAAVRDIFNDAILNTTALYEYRPRSLDVVLQWFGAKARGGQPVIGVTNAAGELCGFASYGPFRPWPAFKYSVEHLVYVHPNWRRRGAGRILLAALVERATAAGHRAMIGGIDADNSASIALHQQLEFVHAGTIRQAGYKFGRWLDLAFYQRLLPGPARATED